ncbi:DUF3618 domain-containing protein [Nitrosomonas supralitoralis]|uniref:DUF3618 domain-containing protein n=1 Tax=Nitrosomonas supralitoralis TaxID=2116706 RepID=A0A2P7NU11_9PROT|nr:DUF3618 domain-containing protein [Nitrosomonas supralitoralis]PSJ16956.1 hypothetical protein C7H79_10670 [Nitrosomonas supralitoralis]
MDNGHRDPREIEADIEKTRNHISETLDDIQDCLVPDQLLEQTFHYFSDQILGSSNFSANLLIEVAKKNPTATALIGLGVGWLIISGKHNKADTQVAGENKDTNSDETVSRNRKKEYLMSNAKNEPGSVDDSVSNRCNGKPVEHVREKLHKQPLVLIGVGVALGAALGMHLTSKYRKD